MKVDEIPEITPLAESPVIDAKPLIENLELLIEQNKLDRAFSAAGFGNNFLKGKIMGLSDAIKVVKSMQKGEL